MISFILWCIAPIFNAIMDLVENENFYQSIFYLKVPDDNPTTIEEQKIEYVKRIKWNNWWYKRMSSRTVKLIFGYRFDAWHLSKSTMVILLASSCIIGIYFEGPLYHIKGVYMWVNALLDITSRLLWWDAGFSLFYHIIFRRKTWGK